MILMIFFSHIIDVFWSCQKQKKMELLPEDTLKGITQKWGRERARSRPIRQQHCWMMSPSCETNRFLPCSTRRQQTALRGVWCN